MVLIGLPEDFDPEELNGHDGESDDSGSDDSSDAGAQAREHYVDVGKSKLRRRDVVPLGPQYKGSRVRREEAFDEDNDDPFERDGWEDDESSDEDVDVNGGVHLSNGAGKGAHGSDTSGSEDGFESDEEDGDSEDASDDEDADDRKMRDDEEIDRGELRRIMADEQKTVAASISTAAKADVEKGKAVKKQRGTFDALLNVRIRMQKSLIATNSLAAEAGEGEEDGNDAMRAAERAAFSLWTALNEFRANLQEARTGTKRKRSNLSTDSPTRELWSQMQSLQASQRPQREAILNKWSARSRSATAVLASSKGRLSNVTEQRLSDVLSAQLLDSSRLVKRTRMARSCAPIQAKAGVQESADIYDDADFYGVLLKELLEQRSSSTGVGSEFTFDAPWQAVRDAKMKKVVDTKASKGRKLRYTVHEKLQNFMAPEDRGTWGERQVDELFGSLFGRKMGLGEDEAPDEESDGEDINGISPEERGLMLFRS